MKLLISVVASTALAVHAAISTPVNHAGNTYLYNGHGKHSLSFGNPASSLEQYYDYESSNGTVMNKSTGQIINPDDDYHEDEIKLSWMWYLKAGWSGAYTSQIESYGSDIWNFEYLVNLFTDASTTIDVDILGVYKFTTTIQVNILDADLIRQQVRWIRPKSLLRGNVDAFDIAFRPYTGFNNLLDISVTFSDALKLSFNKDLAKVFVDIMELGWKEIKHPSNVYSQERKEAFELYDFIPTYQDEFYYGSNVGLMPDNISFNPIRETIRFFKDDQNWDFSVDPVFNWWVFNTRSD